MTGALSPARQAFVSVFVARVSDQPGFTFAVEVRNEGKIALLSEGLNKGLMVMVIGLKARMRKSAA